MAYTPFADGTQAFGIPASPLTINAITDIAEDFTTNNDSLNVLLKDANGSPIGRNIVQGDITGTAKLQLATSTTVLPAKGQQFTFAGVTFWVLNVSAAYTQGGYTYVNITFAFKIN